MARRASFEPKRSGNPRAPWVVNLPAPLSSNGVRERRYFDTQQEAKTFAQQQKIRFGNYGSSAAMLPAGKAEEAAAAFEQLAPLGVGLTEAVRHYIVWRKAHDASVTFSDLLRKFQDAKRGKSKHYLATFRQAETRFARLASLMVSDISATEIDECTAGMTESMRNAFLRSLSAAFNFAIRRGWCETNPIERLEMATVKPRKTLLTNAQVESLLYTAAKQDLKVLPYNLLLIFAGIRPDEIKRLKWSHVNFDEKYIEVPDEASKTDMKRTVDIEPVLGRWLDYLKARDFKFEPDIAIAPKNLIRRLRAVRNAAGLAKWPQDAPRRTYASCWLNAYLKVNKLNQLMGHTSPDMLWKHYHRAVLRKDAQAFWKIEPPPVESEDNPRTVVPFTAEAA